MRAKVIFLATMLVGAVNVAHGRIDPLSKSDVSKTAIGSSNDIQLVVLYQEHGACCRIV